MSESPRGLDVIIIGGSLTGLLAGTTLGTCPQVRSILILERSEQKSLRDFGAGIRLGEEVIEMIARLTQKQPESYATRITHSQSIDRDGLIVKRQPTNSWTSTWTGIYGVLKQQFDSNPRCIYRYGCALTSLHEETQDTVTVRYTTSDDLRRTAIANVVVGADGMSSTVRSFVDPEVGRVTAGYVCYRGTVEQSKVSISTKSLFHEAGTFHWASGSQFVSYPVPSISHIPDRSDCFINWLWYRNRIGGGLDHSFTDKDGQQHRFSLRRGSMMAAEIEALETRALAELAPPCHDVIAQTDEPFIQAITDSLSKYNYSMNGKVLLIGDAVGGQR